MQYHRAGQRCRDEGMTLVPPRSLGPPVTCPLSPRALQASHCKDGAGDIRSGCEQQHSTYSQQLPRGYGAETRADQQSQQRLRAAVAAAVHQFTCASETYSLPRTSIQPRGQCQHLQTQHQGCGGQTGRPGASVAARPLPRAGRKRSQASRAAVRSGQRSGYRLAARWGLYVQGPD